MEDDFLVTRVFLWFRKYLTYMEDDFLVTRVFLWFRKYLTYMEDDFLVMRVFLWFRKYLAYMEDDFLVMRVFLWFRKYFMYIDVDKRTCVKKKNTLCEGLLQFFFVEFITLCYITLKTENLCRQPQQILLVPVTYAT
jgi:hypothetical protein